MIMYVKIKRSAAQAPDFAELRAVIVDLAVSMAPVLVSLTSYHEST